MTHTYVRNNFHIEEVPWSSPEELKSTASRFFPIYFTQYKYSEAIVLWQHLLYVLFGEMILDNLPYITAFLLTASIHMAWPSIPYAIHQQFCLLVSNRSSMGVDIIKLHTFALILLLSSLSFRTTSAAASTAPLPSHQFNQTYNVRKQASSSSSYSSIKEPIILPTAESQILTNAPPLSPFTFLPTYLIDYPNLVRQPAHNPWPRLHNILPSFNLHRLLRARLQKPKSPLHPPLRSQLRNFLSKCATGIEIWSAITAANDSD